MTGARARSGLVLLLAFAAASAVLVRMGEALAPWDGDRPGLGHHYEYLVEGFLAGHTYLALEPSADLLALADPYKPGQVVSQRLLDASLYHGKYYMYYGPAPALALMLPWRALSGRAMPQRMAVALFGVAGLAALALLTQSVARVHFPEAPGPVVGGAFLAAALVSWLPVVVRRPFFWELAIVCAAACLWWALYFLWRFHRSGGRAAWGACAGVALALLIGSRATYVFAAAAALALMLPAGRGMMGRLGFAAAAVIVAAGGVGLLAYNHARFGRWLEFGQSYQLWGDDYRNLTLLSARYVPFNARMYLLSADSPGAFFPFVRPSIPSEGPPGYMGVDEVYGALVAAPIGLAGALALGWLAARRRDARLRPLVLTTAAATAASVLAAAILFSWGGACSRYAAELWAGWAVVTAVGVLAGFCAPYPGRPVVRVALVAAGLWSAGFVCLASMDYDGIMRVSMPRTYAALARALDYPSLWWARATGRGFGPVDVRVRLPSFTRAGTAALLESGRRDRLNQLLLVRTDAAHARLELVEDGARVVVASDALSAADGVVRARIGAPWLYPPSAHPFWDSVPDPAARRALQRGFSLSVAGARPLSAEAASEDAEELEPTAAGPGSPGAAIGWVEAISRAPSSGVVLASGN